MKKSPLILRRIRKRRIRGKIHGTARRPRFSVFRSNRGLKVQIVDDDFGRTITSGGVVSLAKDKVAKSDQAYELGLKIAEKAKKMGIKEVVFDRGGYLYHGRIASLAKGARDGGLIF